jgi:hypothetical protein
LTDSQSAITNAAHGESRWRESSQSNVSASLTGAVLPSLLQSLQPPHVLVGGQAGGALAIIVAKW